MSALNALTIDDEVRMLMPTVAIESLVISCHATCLSRECREQAVQALGNLAGFDDCAPNVIQTGGTEALMKLISGEKAAPLAVATLALEAIACLVEYVGPRQIIIDQGGIKYCSSILLHAPSERLRKAAGWVLVSMAVDPELGVRTVSEGALLGLMEYAMSTEERQQEEAAWALANLSSQSANAEPMGSANVLDTLTKMLKQSGVNQPKVCMQVVWTMANLAVHAPLKSKLAERGAIKELVRQLRLWLPASDKAATAIPDETHEVISLTLHQVARALANLATEQANRAQIAAGDGLEMILRAGSNAMFKDPALKEVLARSLTNLSFESNLSQRIVELGGVPVLVTQLLACESTRVQEEALLVALNLSVRQPQALITDALLGLIVEKLQPRSTARMQERAARVLCNLCVTNMQSKMAIMKNGALRGLNGLINSEGVVKETHDVANEVMQSLSAVLTPTSRRALVQAVLMPPNTEDVKESRSARRGAGTGPSARCSFSALGQATPRRSSPLAMMSARGLALGMEE